MNESPITDGTSTEKHREFLGSALPYKVRVNENSTIPIDGNAQIPTICKYSLESHIIPRLRVFKEIWKNFTPVHGK